MPEKQNWRINPMTTQMTSKASTDFEAVPFRMHPRVFEALGADLVTNDVVAVIELVKNSYDAFAENVWIRFRQEDSGEQYLEIQDDGIGMMRTDIQDVWCMVATPNKEINPTAKRSGKTRRVVGEKGLGRLSVARLGASLNLFTRKRSNPCWQLSVDWTELSNQTELANCFAQCRELDKEEVPFEGTGTLLRVGNLQGTWEDSQIDDLEENLARLISPFSELGEFNIFLSREGELDVSEVHIEPPKFLSRPKYLIEGKVSENGGFQAKYQFNPIGPGKRRQHSSKVSWEQIYDDIQNRERFPFDSGTAHCGSFAFEIRAWDIGSGDTQEISDKFDFQKSQVRKAIRAHKGISVYRDGVLVLPKSDNARDWLGLDLRRVSKVGNRMSTSQLVGYVSITGEQNPAIVDTSDRERLVSNIEVAEFEEILKSIVGVLENEREHDRKVKKEMTPAKNLFGELTADHLITEVEALIEEGAEASETLPLLAAFNKSLDNTRKTIEERFVYYSRLATIGTLSQMLVHEIRNRTTAFGAFLDFVQDRFAPFEDLRFDKQFGYAKNSIIALERLADTFSPLANRNFTRRKRNSILEERLSNCLEVLKADIDRKGIRCSIPKTQTGVAVDPGELESILLNLLTNSIYWLGQVDKANREIQIRLNSISDGERVRVWVHDSGPGVGEEDLELVFNPGVTRKPNGIGMGLTVASEIVNDYSGQMITKSPGTLGGASFGFDLPVKC
ncbi:ATP-binding protein [Stieleria sp. TO1_6]|uniref:sensor histidine kinase n=1 Tax=Stieleria tagensis TaxID=2956795 RepID=UPI00209A8B69|nr:sensor histidine kinase [Stieleria tagensis]MCO8124752.1 ATP-binding protein [Stieleria tagensis]